MTAERERLKRTLRLVRQALDEEPDSHLYRNLEAYLSKELHHVAPPSVSERQSSLTDLPYLCRWLLIPDVLLQP